MDASQIDQLVKSQVGDAWDIANLHGVSPREAVVPATRVKVIERTVVDGRTNDRVVDGWLVGIDNTDGHFGCLVVSALDGSMCGLAGQGFPADEHPVLWGWYGDFMTTFHAM